MAFTHKTTGNTSVLARKRRNRLLVKTFLWGFLVAAVIGGLSALTFLSTFSVQTVTVSGNNVVDTDVLEDFVDARLSGTYGFLVSRRNSLLFPKRAIEKELLETFPRVSSVTLARDSLQSLVLTIRERKPKALWCPGLSPEVANRSIDGCYFIDETGFLFGRAPGFSNNVFMRYFGSTSGTTTIGTFFGGGRFSEYDFFVQSLRDQHITPTDFVALPTGDFELYLVSGGKILFTDRQNLSEVLTTIRTLTEKDGLQLLRPDLKIEYVDLRYGNKVFYKNRQN